MIVKKLKSPIVCDTAGCGKVAAYELIFATGAKMLLCENCAAELKAALCKEKVDGKKIDRV